MKTETMQVDRFLRVPDMSFFPFGARYEPQLMAKLQIPTYVGMIYCWRLHLVELLSRYRLLDNVDFVNASAWIVPREWLFYRWRRFQPYAR
jgi:hypothetical protein